MKCTLQPSEVHPIVFSITVLQHHAAVPKSLKPTEHASELLTTCSDRHAGTEDLTARARVRETAIVLFGHEGFRVSVRAIAKEAGVSPGLVLHHFGSKDGLRRECDRYVLARIREAKEKAVSRGSSGQLLANLASVDESARLVGYAFRCLQARGDIARLFVDHLVADAEE